MKEGDEMNDGDGLDIRAWLESQCNRYKYGQCRALGCLKNGSYQRRQAKLDYGIATCEAHETIKKLSELTTRIEDLEAEIDGFVHGSL